MKITDTISEKIEAFLTGKLPPVERRAFEAEIAADKLLAEEVEIHRLEMEAIDELVGIDLEKDLAKWRKNLEVSPPPPPIFETPKKSDFSIKWVIWAGGLATLVLIGAIIWVSSDNIFDEKKSESQVPVASKSIEPTVPLAPAKPPTGSKNTPEPEKNQGQIVENQKQETVPKEKPATENQNFMTHSEEIYAMADENIDGLSDEIDGQINGNRGFVGGDLFIKGKKAYFKNDYSTAKNDLIQILPDDENYQFAQKILADIYYSEKNFRQAAVCFEKYEAIVNTPQAEWKLIHFYLRDYFFQKPKFWQLLNRMAADPSSPNQNAAAKLIFDLKKMGVSEN